MRASISSSEHQNFPSDGIWFPLTHWIPRGARALRRPKRVYNRHDGWRRRGGQKPPHRYQGGSVCFGIQVDPLSVTSTKGYISFALEKTALLARRFHSRDQLDPPRTMHVPETSLKSTGPTVFLHFRLPNNL